MALGEGVSASVSASAKHCHCIDEELEPLTKSHGNSRGGVVLSAEVADGRFRRPVVVSWVVCSVVALFLVVSLWLSPTLGQRVSHFREERYMGLDETPEEELERIGEAFGTSVCNASIPYLPLPEPRALNMSEDWLKWCQALPHPPSQKPESTNWCWENLKQGGCHVRDAPQTWRADQWRLSKWGEVPNPDNVTMNPLEDRALCDVPHHGWMVPAAHTEPSFDEEESAAKVWFNETFNVYVINLLNFTKRWEVITARLTEQGIGHSRVDGVNMTGPQMFASAKLEGIVTKHAKGDMDLLGNMGHSAAHFRAMKQAVEETSQPLVLILEDDVKISEHFALRLRRILQAEIPCNWDVLSLRSQCPYGTCISRHLTQVVPDGNGDDACHAVNFGFHGMLYQTSALARTMELLLKAVWDEDCLDIDNALAGISDRVAYYAMPSVQWPGLLHEDHNSKSIRQTLNSDLALEEVLQQSLLAA
mmetsp:Transcript_36060/g.95777  ORF Transcript_36060/g.95777 Transcript_36060/m.95777 type:complete len:476 (-) Transcript_36060:350-1777(-)